MLVDLIIYTKNHYEVPFLMVIVSNFNLKKYLTEKYIINKDYNIKSEDTAEIRVEDWQDVLSIIQNVVNRIPEKVDIFIKYV